MARQAWICNLGHQHDTNADANACDEQQAAWAIRTSLFEEVFTALDRAYWLSNDDLQAILDLIKWSSDRNENPEREGDPNT